MNTLIKLWTKYRNTFILVILARVLTYLMEDVVLGEEYFPTGIELTLVVVEQFRGDIIRIGKSILGMS